MTDHIAQTPPTLFEFLSMEENQLLVSLARNREELAVLARMEGLYGAATSYKSVKENDFVIFQMLTFTHYHFLFAIACQLRCHLSEAFASARAAIDAALIAAHIVKDRASQIAYVKREAPFDNFARYLGNLVKDGKPLPHPLMQILITQQKVISTFAAHADVGSFLHRVKKSSQGDQVIMSVEYFQFARNDAERQIHTLTLFHTFVMILDVFADFLVMEQKAVPAQWKKELHQLGQSIERRARELRATLAPADGRA